MNNWLKTLKEHKRFVTDPGSRYKEIYSPVVQSDGHVELVVKEKTCLYDFIQSFKDSCDINVLLRRFAQGDTSALLRGNPVFGDFTEMPKTYAEMLQVVIDGQNYFDTLPSDVRGKFHNNYQEFVSTIGSDAWLNALGIKSEQAAAAAPAQKVESEVVADEA